MNSKILIIIIIVSLANAIEYDENIVNLKLKYLIFFLDKNSL